MPYIKRDIDFVYFRLDLADVRPDLLEPLVRHAEDSGIVLSTFGEMGAHSAMAIAQLHDLALTVHGGPKWTPSWTIDEYMKRFGNFDLVHTAWFEGRYVGYTYLYEDPDVQGRLNQCMTGVRPEMRRRGIGMALKSVGLIEAKRAGYNHVVTGCHQDNLAIINLNMKFGFQDF